MGQLSLDDEATIKSLYVVGGSLSMFASVFILTSFLTIKELRKRDMMQMVFWMSLADFFFTMKFWLPAILDRLAHTVEVNGVVVGVTEAGSSFCQFQAFCGQFFGLASISWYALIAFNVFQAVRDAGALKRHSMRPAFHILVWGSAGITTAIAWGERQFGPSSDGTCWIRDDDSLYRLLFFVPLALYMLGSILLLILLVRNRKRLRYGSGSTFPRMVAFVVVFVLVWIWSLLFRAAEAAGKDPAGLRYMHTFAVSGQAFFNFCVWITSPAFQTCAMAMVVRRFLFGSALLDSTTHSLATTDKTGKSGGSDTHTSGSKTAGSSRSHSVSQHSAPRSVDDSPALSRITAVAVPASVQSRRLSEDDGGEIRDIVYVRLDDHDNERTAHPAPRGSSSETEMQKR